jgi:hypothetical protein
MTLLLAPIATGGKAKPAITINLIILHLPKPSNHSDLSQQEDGLALVFKQRPKLTDWSLEGLR